MDKIRQYEGWWYGRDELPKEKEASLTTDQQSSDVTWFPLPARDSDQLEYAYEQKTEDHNVVVIYGKTPHRLWKVDL